MNRSRYSRIAHGDLSVWNPVGLGQLQHFVSQLGLSSDSAILDIGCGRGRVLELILTQYRTRGVGVDCSPDAIAQASEDLAPLVAAGRLTLVEQAFEASQFGEASFNLIACIGATHACGGLQKTLKCAAVLLRPRGLVLVGEGYWKCPPAPEYLAFLQATADDYSTHQGNQNTGINLGFELVACSECSQAEWDAYEDQYARNVEDYVQANGHDPDATTMRERIRSWREAYSRWGRETLGFGLYLFRMRTFQAACDSVSVSISRSLATPVPGSGMNIGTRRRYSS